MTVATHGGVAEIVERVRGAMASRVPLRIVGSGTWLGGGRRCAAEARLDLRALSGITRYEPGDFVLTARAGTSLSVIATAAAEHGQWLTLDPIGDSSGSIGATVATASYGPLASAFGTPRDHVLGCEFVSGRGDVVRAGGQVVKNVAGFDLTRLVTGAWGTLGVLTEVTVRMRARPESDQTLAIALGDTGAASLWRWLRDSEFTPLAAELLSESLANQLGLGQTQVALVRVGGNAALVRAAVSSASAVGEARVLGVSVWDAWRSAFADTAFTFRMSALPTKARDHWPGIAQWAERQSGFASATLARGVIRCALPQTAHEARIPREGLTVTGEQLSESQWHALERPRSTSPLEARVRETFDPEHILNPGILGA
jgi:glycolate oxidase FAD binding subunit